MDEMPLKGHPGGGIGRLFEGRGSLRRAVGSIQLAIQLADRAEVNLANTAQNVVFAGIQPPTEFTFNMHVRALGNVLGEIATLAPGDHAMPFGARHELAGLLVAPRALRRE